MLDFWAQYPILKKQLRDVPEYIDHHIDLSLPEIQQSLRDLNHSGGKLLRPGLFLIFLQLNNHSYDKQYHAPIASSIEILHMASLIHDDIIDDSPLRRGNITIQSKYGKDVAVYAGDYLFTLFFQFIIDHITDYKLLKENQIVMQQVLTGELSQMHLRYNYHQSIEDYLYSIQGKTAALFSLACYEGAVLGGCNEERQELAKKIGKNIGIIFQIYDDILDYTAKRDVFKKPVLEDISQGIYTLPLLFALKNDKTPFLPYLEKQQKITIEETKQVAQLVEKYNGITAAQNYAKELSHQTAQLIQGLPDSKGKRLLQKLEPLLIKRTH